MAFHREQRQADLVAEGMSVEEARQAASREFGNAEHFEEASRDVFAFRIETVAQDLRFAIRQLKHNPIFAGTIIFVLALGICAAVSIFSFVDAALIKPLPYADPNRLVDVAESAMPHYSRTELSYEDFKDWQRLNTVFEAFDGYNESGFLVSMPSGAQPATAARVTAGFFRTLGVAPLLGRDFRAGEDQGSGARVVMLSYGAWQKFYSGRKEVVGSAVRLGDDLYEIVGVLPPDFHFAPANDALYWPAFHAERGCDKRRSCNNMFAVGRLKPGVSIASAQAEMQGIARQLEIQFPDSNRGQGASVIALSEAVSGGLRPIFLTLLAGAGLLLLVACINASSLLLARSESRSREIAVRGALGASRRRLGAQFVVESLVLVVTAFAIGLAAATVCMRLLLALIPEDMMARVPFLLGLSLNWRVLGFAVLLAFCAAGLFAASPFLSSSLRSMRDGLTEAGRGSSGTAWRRFGSNLVIAELAVAVVLLVAAGLLGKSLYRLLHVDLGFRADHLATFEVAVPNAPYAKPEQQVAVAHKIAAQIEAVPGVKSVAFVSTLPVSCNCNTNWIRVVGQPYNGEHNEVNERDVSPNYFSTVQAQLLRGRYFEASDDLTKPKYMIINESFAKKYFGAEEPIGKQIGDTQVTAKSLRQVIGVVEDIKDAGLDTETWPAEYESFEQEPDTNYDVVVRTSSDSGSLMPSLVSAVRQVDVGIGVSNELTMEQRITNSPAAYIHRSSSRLVASFAAVALVLSVIGLYGVIAYSVSQRTREIGVRMALGAEKASVYRLILKEAGGLIAVGIVIGVICSIGAAQLMRSLLFGVRGWDVPTLAGVAVTLATCALVASVLPAHRAASVDPRSEEHTS